MVYSSRHQEKQNRSKLYCTGEFWQGVEMWNALEEAVRPLGVAIGTIAIAGLFYGGLLLLIGINVFDLELGWLGWACIGAVFIFGFGMLCLTLPRARDENVQDFDWREGDDGNVS